MDALGITSIVIQTLTLLFAALAVAVAYREARLIRTDLHIAQTTAWAEFLLRLDQRFLEHPLRDVASQIEGAL